MIYSVEKTIRHKVIKKEDIIAIAKFFQTLVDTEGGTFTIAVVLRDKTYLSVVNIEYFSSYGRKDFHSIRFSYQNKSGDNRLEIYLEEAISWMLSMSTYQISSSDEGWYNAMRSHISDLFTNISRCNWLRMMFDIPLAILGHALFFAIIAIILSGLLGFDYGERPMGAHSITGKAYDEYVAENSVLFIPARDVYLFSLITWYPSCVFIRWLYPDVEFSFDSPSDKKRKRIRKIFFWIFSTIIVPVILGLVL